MKQTSRGERQTVSTPPPMRIILQPGQVLVIAVADGSGVVPRSALDQMAALMSSFPDSSSVSPARDPDSSSVSPAASKDRSGRP